MNVASSGRRFVTIVLLGFAMLALVLAAVGVYGVAAYSVSRRTREIGVRMSLGAAPLFVYRRILGEGMALAVAGIGAGVLFALALTRTLRALLFGTSPDDPTTFVTAIVTVTIAALLATAVPAWRATRVQPTEALRAE